MTTAIPIDQIVSITPGVVSAGGVEGLLTAVVFSQDEALPFGALWTAYAASDVIDYFGAATNESEIGTNYFPGIVNGGQLPYNLVYTRYAASAGGASIYGATSDLTLQEMQDLSGDISIYSNGVTFTAKAVSLAPATSLPDVATILQAAFKSPTFTFAYDDTRDRITVTSTTTGTDSNMADASGSLATSLGLTEAAGATLVPQGFEADTPDVAFARLIAATDNFATWTHAWAATLDDRLAFAAANSQQATDKYLYVGWDTDAAGATASNAASFGYQVKSTFAYEGTIPVYGTHVHAAGVMAWAAATDYDVTNGRTNLAGRQMSSGAAASVTTKALANALLTNYYTYYGFYKKGSNTWNIFYNGQVSGKFLWSDTYLDQIWLNNNLQLSLFSAFVAYKSMPYNADGYMDIYAAGKTVIDAAVTNGVIRAGVTLTDSQVQQINSAAGLDAASSISTRGWYFLVSDPASVGTARTARTSPQCTLWYADGGSIQQISVGSNAVL